MDLPFLALSFAVNWRPRIGDPTLPGWIVTISYGIAATLCFMAARDALKNTSPAIARIWASLTLFLLLLGLNKQLDLQTLFTEFGKGMAHAQGWFDVRRTAQQVFVTGVVTAAMIVFAMSRRQVALFMRRHPRGLVGFLLVCAYVFVRLVSFEHIDTLVGVNLRDLAWLWLLELAGVLTLAGSAFSATRKQRASSALASLRPASKTVARS
jgi:hypothetical protein